MCCLCNAKKCLRMFKSVSILIFDQNSINGRYFQHPRGILDAIISVTEGLNSLGTLYIARFHKYAPLLRDPKMIPSCSRCVGIADSTAGMVSSSRSVRSISLPLVDSVPVSTIASIATISSVSRETLGAPV